MLIELKTFWLHGLLQEIQFHFTTSLNLRSQKQPMTIEVLKSKIHRCVITEANLNYIGSCTIDEDLMDAAGLIANEKITIVDVNNGNRLETYVIKGERKSGIISLNGAAARLVQPGDIAIIMGYGTMDFEEAKTFVPKVIFPKEGNRL